MNLRARLESRLSCLWYGERKFFYWLLLPLSWLYCAWVSTRAALYRRGLLKTDALDCPVVIVGNLVAGGSGKTPLVAALAQALTRHGLRVGIICRGYRGRAQQWPQQVTAASDPLLVGDEAVLLAQLTGVAVVAGADRVAAGRELLKASHCDIVLSDDGLQHYRLQRDVEIALIEAGRGLGNGQCLPAGPLREPAHRLSRVDRIVGYGGSVRQGSLTVRPQLDTGCQSLLEPAKRRTLTDFSAGPVHAVAGIANPQRFFNALHQQGLDVIEHVFEDHHRFSADDLSFDTRYPVLMTGKDAVKCSAFAQPDWWCVPLRVQLDPALENWLIDTIGLTEP